MFSRARFGPNVTHHNPASVESLAGGFSARTRCFGAAPASASLSSASGRGDLALPVVLEHPVTADVAHLLPRLRCQPPLAVGPSSHWTALMYITCNSSVLQNL